MGHSKSMNELTEKQAEAFLSAFRDNLLKPMATEICREQNAALEKSEKRLEDGLQKQLNLFASQFLKFREEVQQTITSTADDTCQRLAQTQQQIQKTQEENGTLQLFSCLKQAAQKIAWEGQADHE